ncbi:MAG: TPM domain-containing protein [Solimonas sp.]
MLRRALAALMLLAAVLVPAPAGADVAVPALTARVNDQTGTLDAGQRAQLEQKLAAFEQAKGSQIAVLIVPSTEPETIEQYSIRVAEQWKLGRKGVDDGLLILVARNDRAIRIEVGYGLEGVVPDAIANRVVDETIVPRFRDGDYYGGLDAGVTQLIGVIDGEPLPPPPQRPGSGRRVDGKLESMIPVLFFALIAAQFLRRIFGHGLGSVLAGGGVFGLVWLLTGALTLAAFFGVAALVLTLLGIAIPLGGGGWSSRGGGGGFGGGGFGGGGGGFGGGGASGRW